MGEITLQYLFGVARRRWRLISLALLATTTVVAWVTFFVLTPVYKSTGVVLLKPGREFVYGAELGDRTNLPSRMDGIVRAELEILHSDDLLREVVSALDPLRLYPDREDDQPALLRVLRRFRRWAKTLVTSEVGGTPDPLHGAVLAFRQDLSAVVVPGTEVIRISFYHHDADIAAESVNVLVEHLKGHHLRAFSESHSTRFMEGRVEGYRDELAGLEEKLRGFQQDHPILAIESPANMLEEQRVQLDLARKQSSNEIAALNRRVQYLKEHQETLARTSLLREEIDVQIIGGTAKVFAEVGRRKGLEGQLAEVESELRDLPNQLRAYGALVRDRAAAERRYRIYAERLEQALISDEMDRQRIANISVIQKARRQPEPARPRKLLNLIVGVALGLVLGFGPALLLEGAKTNKKTEETEESEAS
jgi:uncharacterized protein involved in exopolysaccharide biosynthesis